MEKELNIAAILKDKPVGLKFYSPTFGRITFNGVHKGKVYFFSDDTNAHSVKQNGKMYDGGECIIFPSKEMRDWSKFAWKKGDVLVSKDRNVHIIFEKFDDDEYTSFVGKHYLESYGKDGELLDYEEIHFGSTVNYTKESEESAQAYIKAVEERLGGKLNQKAQPEFKDGDIAFADYGNRQDVFIVSGKTNLSEGYNSFISLNLRGLTLNMGYRTSFFKKNLRELRLATEEEKKQLFSALEKEGKRWDAENKMVVDLKPKCEFKPFDKVLVRDSESDKWRANLFGYISEDGYYCCIFASWVYCIPYAGNEYLLDTTKDVEG